METAVVETLAGLEAIAPEWSALAARSARATPFQRPEWLVPWARAFVRGPIVTVTVRRRGELAAVLPLFRWDDAGERRLCLFGHGVTDYLDATLDDACAAAALGAALDAVRDLGDWDVCAFDQLRPSSELARWARDGLEVDTRDGEPCPALALPDGASLADVAPAHTLAKLERHRRRAGRRGALEVEIADASNVDACLDELFRLHALRWRDAESPTALELPETRAFVRDAARSLVRIGLVRLYVVTLERAPFAALLALLEHGRFHMYAQAFDPAFAALSPGLLVLGAALEDAVALGAHELDFLRGREPYKYTWGAVDRPTLCRRMRRRAC